MSESLLLAACGAALGGVLAYLLSRGLVRFLSSGTQKLYLPLGLDWRVLGFTAAVALLTCLLFGLAPAVRAVRTRPADAMRGGRGTAAGSEHHRLRRALVVAQVALSFVLLVGALLFGQSFRNLMSTNIGMDSEGVLVAGVDASLSDLDPERRTAVFHELEERFNRMPGVVSAGAVRHSPFGGTGWNQAVHADNDSATSGGKYAWFNRISPNYFRTMKTPLLAGRNFTVHDRIGSPPVAIVNDKFVQDFFGGGNAIGRTFRYEGDVGRPDPVFEVVGVVANTKYRELREETAPVAFLPLDQAAPDINLTFMIRARGSFTGVMAGVRREMATINGGLQVDFHVLDVQVEQSVLRDRLMANLTGGFGLLATILSTLGLYGVMSYMVARRRNEIGVRMALGAETRQVVGLVFGEAGWLPVAGLALGLAGSFALSRYAASLLFGLKPNDTATLALGCALMAATAAAAALIPARRATHLDPAVVLRHE